MMSIQQPFAPQPGGMVHPGMQPGHQMAPGQPGHPGHLVGPGPGGMVQQMHPGVSGPQVTQGPVVTGMPQGVGMGTGVGVPSAHAMSHLGPSQANFLHQQNMTANFATNPHIMQHQQNQQNQAQYARQRQQMMAHQQQAAQQAAMAQQQQGIPVSMPNGQHPINAAQLQAMQQAGQMQAGNMHMQMQRPQVQNQQMPQNIEAYHQQRIAQQMAMQQAQANNGQPGQPPPPRPPTAQQMQMQEQGGAPQAQQQQPQRQPPVTQGQQPQPPNPQQQPQPQPTPQQQNQQLPQQNPNQQQQSQGGQQQMNPQDVAQLKAQQQEATQAAMMQARLQQQQQQQQQQAQSNKSGNSVLSLISFGDHLSRFSSKTRSNDLGYWTLFVDKFFSPNGVLRQQLWNSKDQSTKTYEINYAALPRYYLTLFSSGIHNIQMILENAREKELGNGGHFVESAKSSFIYWLTNDCQLVTLGNLRAQFDSNGKMDMLDLVTTEHTEYIPRAILRQAPESPDQKSPKVNKNLGKRAQRQPPPPTQPSITLPTPTTNDHGITNQLLQFLELAETFSQMQYLFQFSQNNPHLPPSDALQTLVNNFRNGPMANQQLQGGMPPNMNMQMQMQMQGNMQNAHLNPGSMPQMPPGQRTPGLGGPNAFASPAVAHLGLPNAQNSPHLSSGGAPGHSPAQTHLAGPVAMVAQQSQTGTNASGSQGTSANTSPNVTNKRRRASAVKLEDEGPEVNGTGGASKVKASPRPGGKRQKGTQ